MILERPCRRDWGLEADRPDAPTIHVRVLGFVGLIDVWRVPQDMRAASYSDIFRQLQDRPHARPADTAGYLPRSSDPGARQ